MAAPKAVKNLAGDLPSAARVSYDPPSVPPDPFAVWQAVLQLQNTVNALIALYNAHTHTGVTTGAGTSGAPAAPVTNTNINAQAAQSLFTTS